MQTLNQKHGFARHKKWDSSKPIKCNNVFRRNHIKCLMLKWYSTAAKLAAAFLISITASLFLFIAPASAGELRCYGDLACLQLSVYTSDCAGGGWANNSDGSKSCHF